MAVSICGGVKIPFGLSCLHTLGLFLVSKQVRLQRAKVKSRILFAVCRILAQVHRTWQIAI